jgi:anti-sigma factor RsiW
MSDPHHPGHVSDELAGLLSGECDRDATSAVAAHLRACPQCADELISVAVVTGALRYANRAQRALDTPSWPSGESDPSQALDVDRTQTAGAASRQVATLLRRDRRRQQARRAIAAAAAIILLAAGAFIGDRLHHHASPPTAPVALRAPLRPVHAPANAGGQIEVTATGNIRQLDVHARGLPAPPANHYYEVWVFNPATLKMLPMGILGPSGQGQYQIAAPIMAGYSAIDISLQPNNGDPAHSNISVLRAYV